MGNKVWLAVMIIIISLWTYKVFQTTQAYDIARMEIAKYSQIEETLGKYEVSYDWWLGAFRAIQFGKVQEFEFHFTGEKDQAVGVIEVVKSQAEWKVSCVNVVNGEYLNKKIVQECHGAVTL